MKNPLLISLLLFTVTTQKVERIDWFKIVPFHTTRAEVETILGAPVMGSDYVFSYDTRDDRITVWYGGAKPWKDDPCKWALPEDSVFSFVYAPKKKFPLSELNVDLSKFKKEKAVEMVNDFYYYNPAEGLTLTTRLVDGEERFLTLERNPNQALREKYCKQP